MKNNQPLWILGHKIRLHETTGDYDLAQFITPAKSQGPPPHSHHKYEESFLIIEGEMEFMVNGETKTYAAGESIDIPPGTLHTFSNTSDKPCKWINIHSPKGFSKFFKDFGVRSDEEKAVLKSVEPELIQKVLQTAAKYDMNIPPPPGK